MQVSVEFLSQAPLMGVATSAWASWSERLGPVADRLAPWLGGWIRGEAAWGITWIEIFASATLLLMVVLVWEVLGILLKRWSRRPDSLAVRTEPALATEPRLSRLTVGAVIPAVAEATSGLRLVEGKQV